MSESSRYPYTYACDYIRGMVEVQNQELGGIYVPLLSRSQAAKIRHRLSEDLGLDDYAVACKLADLYLTRECGWRND